MQIEHNDNDVINLESTLLQHECISQRTTPASARDEPSVPSFWIRRSEPVRDLPDEADDRVLPAVLQHRSDSEWWRPRCYSVGSIAGKYDVIARCPWVQL